MKKYLVVIASTFLVICNITIAEANEAQDSLSSVSNRIMLIINEALNCNIDSNTTALPKDISFAKNIVKGVYNEIDRDSKTAKTDDQKLLNSKLLTVASLYDLALTSLDSYIKTENSENLQLAISSKALGDLINSGIKK